MSEDDLQGIQTNLNGLSSNQKKITHVLQQSLTIINSTRLAIKENRQKIDEILSALVTLTQQLRNISTSLEKQVHKLDYFVNANLRVSRAVQEVQAMTSEVCSHVGGGSLMDINECCVSRKNVRKSRKDKLYRIKT